MSELVIVEMPVHLFLEEAVALFEAHADEVVNAGRERPAPDWQRIIALSMTRHLTGFTARRDGELLGCALFLLQHSLIYRGRQIATLGEIFVKAAHRGPVSVALVRQAVRTLIARVDEVHVAERAAGPGERARLGSLLAAEGFKPFENAWRAEQRELVPAEGVNA